MKVFDWCVSGIFGSVKNIFYGIMVWGCGSVVGGWGFVCGRRCGFWYGCIILYVI